ncbi:MAG: HD domain-containing protein [Coriobacteriales bacterium]|jgi:tRNA nucleotidyltransferase (CCA-adding enzyme)|nr:HD domain-containing protein [Coriobacteriales bacterium]
MAEIRKAAVMGASPQVVLAIPPQVTTLIEALEVGGFEAWVVGGCVRDQLLGREPKDWDITTSAKPGQAKRLLGPTGARLIDTGIAHGTLTVILDGLPIELTTYRVEARYLDGRHPSKVDFVTSLTEDLGRRDFTMNAIAWHPQRGLADPYGGQTDIAARLIRTVGDANQRLSEDALRILRALRFASELSFALADDLAGALHARCQLLARVAPERLMPELLRLLCGDEVLEVLLAYPDVLAVMIPEITATIGFEQHTPYHAWDVWEHTARAVAASEPDPLVRLSLLMHDLGKPATFFTGEDGRGHFYGHNMVGEKLARARLSALRADNETIDAVAEMVRWHQENIKPENLLRWLNRLGEEHLRKLLAVKQGDMAAHAGDLVNERLERIATTRQALEDLLASAPAYRRVDLAVDGYDLMELGFEPGKRLGRALDALLDAVIGDSVPNDREALLIAARSLLADETL